MSLLPRISIAVGWHVHSRWTIVPVTVSFNHSVFCTFAHTPEKFHGNRIQDERDIIVFSVFCWLCYFSSVAPLFGSDVPHNTLVKSSNHSYSMCVLSLHMPLQSFMAIRSNMEEIWSYLLLTVPAAPQQEFLLIGMCIPIVQSLQWPCPSTKMCLMSLHKSLRNFVAIGSKTNHISFF